MHPTTALRMFQPTRRMMRPMPKEDQAAHTISQRLRTLKRVPPELIPIGVVVLFAISAAAYSLANKFVVDKTMRLSRQNRKAGE